jgi:chaperonin cofactor prefoldin
MAEVTDRYQRQLAAEREDLELQIRTLQGEVKEREAAIDDLTRRLNATVALASHIEKGSP